MKISYEQIKSVAFGYVRCVEENDGLHFYKCTEKQIDEWRKRRAELGDRASGCTGVRLDFHTDSQHFAFRAPFSGKYELYVDGLLRKQFITNASNPEGSFELCDPLGNKKNEYRVTLYFPSHDMNGIIEWVELDDNASITPHKYDKKWLFIGDSITQGWASQYDSLSYALRTARYFNADCVIQGIGGAYFHEDMFDSIDFDPDIVLIAYGTNDFDYYKTLDEFRKHTRTHLALIAKEYEGKKLFAISPIWRGKTDGKAMGSFEECRAVVIEEALAAGFIHIDGLYLVPPIQNLFYDAYLHPNDNGFSVYAENLIAELVKYL